MRHNCDPVATLWRHAPDEQPPPTSVGVHQRPLAPSTSGGGVAVPVQSSVAMGRFVMLSSHDAWLPPAPPSGPPAIGLQPPSLSNMNVGPPQLVYPNLTTTVTFVHGLSLGGSQVQEHRGSA